MLGRDIEGAIKTFIIVCILAIVCIMGISCYTQSTNKSKLRNAISSGYTVELNGSEIVLDEASIGEIVSKYNVIYDLGGKRAILDQKDTRKTSFIPVLIPH